MTQPVLHPLNADAHGAPAVDVPPGGRRRPRLAKQPVIERTWTPDRDAMAAALRVALGLPRLLSHPAGGGKR